MLPFVSETGVLAPFPFDNVDTDVIMPKQFLKRIDREGLAEGVFHDLRFDGEGRERPDFVLNQPPYRGASFLLAGENFACGSSREHAVWGLLQLGIKAIFAQSFAGIFFDNAAQNGLLLIVIDEEMNETLQNHASGKFITVDLDTKSISLPERTSLPFQIEDWRRDKLMQGKDLVQETLEYADVIRAYKDKRHTTHPWLLSARSAS